MSAEIMTLCPACEDLMRDGFRVTKISVKTDTKKHETCDICKRRYNSSVLAQYTVIAKKK